MVIEEGSFVHDIRIVLIPMQGIVLILTTYLGLILIVFGVFNEIVKVN